MTEDWQPMETALEKLDQRILVSVDPPEPGSVEHVRDYLGKKHVAIATWLQLDADKPARWLLANLPMPGTPRRPEEIGTPMVVATPSPIPPPERPMAIGMATEVPTPNPIKVGPKPGRTLQAGTKSDPRRSPDDDERFRPPDEILGGQRLEDEL